MNNEQRIEVLNEQMRTNLKMARQITNRAESEGRGLNEREDYRVKAILANVQERKEEREAIEAGLNNANGIRSSIYATKADGFTAAAKALIGAEYGGRHFQGHTADLLFKDVTHSSLTSSDNTVQQTPGVRGLLEDRRRLYRVFPTQALQAGALTIRDYFIASRSVSGDVERDPLAVDAKAAVDVTISLDDEAVRQFAAISDDLPAQLFKSEPALEGVLRTSIGVVLDDAVEAHVLAKLDAAVTQYSGGGSTVAEKIAYAAQQVKDRGGNPNFAIINSTDFTEIQVTPAIDLPSQYPYGLTIIGLPGVGSSDGIVGDSSGAILYTGPSEWMADPYSSMDTNEIRVRLEHNAVFHVKEADKFTYLAAPSITT